MTVRPIVFMTVGVLAVGASGAAVAQDATLADKPPVAIAPDAGCVPQPDCLVMDPNATPDTPTGHTHHYKRVIKRDQPADTETPADGPSLKSR